MCVTLVYMMTTIATIAIEPGDIETKGIKRFEKHTINT